MTLKSMFRSILLIAAAALCLSAAAAPAAVIYSTDFEGPAGTTPPGWSDTSLLKLSGTGQYEHTGTTSFALSYYNDASFFNGTVEADFQLGNSTAGVVGRLQNTSNFYHVRLHSKSLQIYAFGLGISGYMGSVPVPNYDSYPADELWSISATFLGPGITATLRDSGGTAVSTLTVFDFANTTAGKAGVRSRDESKWETFTISEVTPFTITTADGVGADAFIETRHGGLYGGTNFGTGTSVQLKNAGPDPDNNGNYLSRKTYLRFDLDAIGALDTEIAWLELVANGAGGAYAFDVYGLLDGHAGESWIESGIGGITWNNAPGNDTGDLDGVLGDDTVFLGQFTTAGYSAGQILQFGSGELIDFLNADTDRQVTLILTRNTHSDDFFDSSNTFYSKEGSFATMGDYSFAPRLIVYAVPEPSTLMLSLLGLFPLVLCLRPRRR